MRVETCLGIRAMLSLWLVKKVCIRSPLEQMEMSFAQAVNGQCSMTYKTELQHPPADPENLRTSSHIRSGLHEAALNLGMTESRLKNCEDDTEYFHN